VNARLECIIQDREAVGQFDLCQQTRQVGNFAQIGTVSGGEHHTVGS
jgi:hypothetical protein